MAVCLAKSRPDLFITMTGTTITKELYRLKDGRSKNELVELANSIMFSNEYDWPVSLRNICIETKRIVGRYCEETNFWSSSWSNLGH